MGSNNYLALHHPLCLSRALLNNPSNIKFLLKKIRERRESNPGLLLVIRVKKNDGAMAALSHPWPTAMTWPLPTGGGQDADKEWGHIG